MLRRLLALGWRMRGKPPRVLACKACQYANLAAHHYLRLWRRHERVSQRRWSEDAVARLAASLPEVPGALITAPGIEAVRTLLQQRTDLRRQLAEERDRVVAGKVRVFESTVELPDWEEVNWCEDWRFGQSWPPAFYRQYNFYEFEKPAPYDVKYPWELSRLNFVMIPTLLAVVDQDESWLKTLDRVLTSWQQGNPYAGSVNWYPMECAMRGVNLVLLLSLLAQMESVDVRLAQKVAVLCELHGRFLYRTVEYSDLRGNHFAAEIVALLLLGLTLRGEVPEARRWVNYARRFVEQEVLTQFSADGVQFEKSTAYHRLVTQLFLLAFMALERSGFEVEATAKQCLHEACRYTRAYTRPDGMAPIWGDSDDARCTWFDLSHQRDHRHLTDLAAEYFGDTSLTRPEPRSIDVSLFSGRAPRVFGQSPKRDPGCLLDPGHPRSDT